MQRGKTDGDAAPPSSTNRLEESDPVQQDSQRPRAAEGSDPEDETTEKKDYNQREETGWRWAYEKLEPWSEWIGAAAKMSPRMRRTLR